MVGLLSSCSVSRRWDSLPRPKPTLGCGERGQLVRLQPCNHGDPGPCRCPALPLGPGCRVTPTCLTRLAGFLGPGRGGAAFLRTQPAFHPDPPGTASSCTRCALQLGQRRPAPPKGPPWPSLPLMEQEPQTLLPLLASESPLCVRAPHRGLGSLQPLSDYAGPRAPHLCPALLRGVDPRWWCRPECVKLSLVESHSASGGRPSSQGCVSAQLGLVLGAGGVPAPCDTCLCPSPPQVRGLSFDSLAWGSPSAQPRSVPLVNRALLLGVHHPDPPWLEAQAHETFLEK